MSQFHDIKEEGDDHEKSASGNSFDRAGSPLGPDYDASPEKKVRLS